MKWNAPPEVADLHPDGGERFSDQAVMVENRQTEKKCQDGAQFSPGIVVGTSAADQPRETTAADLTRGVLFDRVMGAP